MKLYVVYSNFTDDPSIVKGIFSTYEDAIECLSNWNDNFKNIQEFELNETLEEPISLN